MRARPSFQATAAVVILVVFTVWITWRAKAIEAKLSSTAETPDVVGKPAPDFQLLSLGGGPVSLADFRGRKNLVVSIWASWCGPCRMELPQLAAFYRQTHKADSDFDIVAISIDEDPEAARAAAARMKLPFTVLVDPRDKISELYGVNAIPALFVIDKNGRVSHAQVGYEVTLEFVLAQQLGIKGYKPEVNSDAGSH